MIEETNEKPCRVGGGKGGGSERGGGKGGVRVE